MTNKWNELTEKEKLAYFGGLIDGEGCITLSRHGGGSRPIIQLQMTCRETVKRFGDYFGLVVRDLHSPSRQNEKWKPLFQCRAECLKALPIIKTLQPYLFTKLSDSIKTLEYYVGRKCAVCEKELRDDQNKSTKYCSAACRQKNKRKRAN